jgi:hypothetical protein
MFELREQASPISEGVPKIQINSHLSREITWQHDTREPWRQHDWPPFAMTITESGPVVPRPGADFQVKTSMGSPWVAWTLSLLSSVKQGKVSSNSVTFEATKFVGLHISCMLQYISNACCNGSQPTRSLINTSGATTFGAPNMKRDHSHSFPYVFSTFT